MSENLTTEELDEIEELLKGNRKSLLHLSRGAIQALVDMARQKLELEAKVQELEAQRDNARRLHPTLEAAEARIQELEAQAVAMYKTLQHCYDLRFKLSWADPDIVEEINQALSGATDKVLLGCDAGYDDGFSDGIEAVLTRLRRVGSEPFVVELKRLSTEKLGGLDE